MEFSLVLNGQSREVKICDQITGCSRCGRETFQQIEMTRPGLENPDLRLIKPRADVSERALNGQRLDA